MPPAALPQSPTTNTTNTSVWHSPPSARRPPRSAPRRPAHATRPSRTSRAACAPSSRARGCDSVPQPRRPRTPPLATEHPVKPPATPRRRERRRRRLLHQREGNPTGAQSRLPTRERKACCPELQTAQLHQTFARSFHWERSPTFLNLHWFFAFEDPCLHARDTTDQTDGSGTEEKTSAGR